jgi:penicillin-binding protein 1C
MARANALRGRPARWLRQGAAAGLASFALLLMVTAAAVIIEPLPVAIRDRRNGLGLIVQDSLGRTLGQCRGNDFALASPVRLVDVPRSVRAAMIAAEDARFYRHRGVDPLAVARAILQLIREGRVVSGASTITQQLARSVTARPRTLYGKWRELVVSLRIESDLSKQEILEAYLNHVPFGPTTRGLGVVADDYTGKPLAALSIAESAELAALPKGPTRYHPRRHLAQLLARRNKIIERMHALRFISSDEARLAALEPASISELSRGRRAAHFVRAVAGGRFDDHDAALRHAAAVQSTLDRELQREVEKLVEDARDNLERAQASAAAVVVLDNLQAELLAYVGSIDFFDPRGLGQNDGCLALRQPGSALKPFVYAAGIEWLGMGPTTQLMDIETKFQTPSGLFAPKNYDGRFHGLVLLREALGGSLNIPAVQVAERVGIERLLPLLREFGFRSLHEPASHYGLAVALGDGEVRLLELAEAYSALARGGVHLPLRVASSVVDSSGQRHPVGLREGKRVVSEATAWQLLEILSDDRARALSFGRHGTLEFPFAAAVKTGTSSNLRDNWAVAVTHEVTVAVWVGNFDGRPLAHGTSGVVGAGPLVRSVTQAAMRGRFAAALFPPESMRTRGICKLSGQRPGPDCTDTLEIRESQGRGTSELCTMHRRVRIDPQNGLLAGPGCPDAVERVVESYPDILLDWARAVGRPVAPSEESARCPGLATPDHAKRVRLSVPESGARYFLDPHLASSQQRLKLRVSVPPNTAWVIYDVDGRTSDRIRPPFEWLWPLQLGRHVARVQSSEGLSDEAQFEVE